MSDDTLFEDEFGVADTNDDIFQPEVNRSVPIEPAYEPVRPIPKRIMITMDVPSVLKELLYHFELPDLERISRALTDVIPIYNKIGILESTPPPWNEEPEHKTKPKSHDPKPAREKPYRFTADEVVEFTRLADEGVSFEDIAKRSGRSVLGVKRAVLRHRQKSKFSDEV